MKLKIFYIPVLLFLFIICMHITGYGNNTRAYCENQINLAKIERDKANYTKSIEMLLEVKPIAENNNWTDLQIRILHIIAIMHARMLNYEKSIEYFLESYKLALKTSDKLQEIRILNNIAHIYIATNEINKAREYIEKAYEGAVRLQDSARIGKFAANLAFIANETGDLDLAKEYLDIAFSATNYYLHDTAFLINTYLEKAKNLLLRKRYNEAEELLLKTLESFSVNKFKHDNFIIECLLTLSKVYQEKGETQKSIYYLKDALNRKPNLSMRILLYEQLSNYYRDNNALFYALQYQDSMIMAKDSLVRLNDMTRTINSQMRFDLLNSEKALAENKAKQKEERIIFVFIILFAFILIWVFRIQSIKSRQQKTIAENKQKIAELELDKEKNNKLILSQQLKEQETLALLEQERLNNEIDTKNRQIAAKALFQSSRNELIGEIVGSLSGLSDKLPDSSLDPIIKQLKSQIKTSTEWDGFLTHFEQINTHFIDTIKERYPGLSANDIRLLSYIYLNLNTKEISSLLNITTEYCKKKKQQLAKKMGLTTSAQLYHYLMEI